jgi:hypothetical protein
MQHQSKWGRQLVTLACITVGLLQPVWAQSFPSKNVSLVVPFPPGGGPDLMARVFAEKLAAQWGKPVVVENRPGAGALIGAQAVAKSPADGHTLLLTTNTMVISPHVLAPGAGGGIDVHNDLMPIVAPATTPMALLASPTLNVKNKPVCPMAVLAMALPCTLLARCSNVLQALICSTCLTRGSTRLSWLHWVVKSNFCSSVWAALCRTSNPASWYPWP